MNCDYCGQHILATMQIAWQGGNFHPDCIGEAVAKYRASENREDSEIKEAFEEFNEDDDFDRQFADEMDVEYEEDYDDLEPEEERDKPPVIVPEVIETGAGGEQREAHIHDIVRHVGNQIAAERGGENGFNSQLMVHCGAQRITRQELANLNVPEATATFKPIAHSTLVDVIEEALAFRHIRITGQEFAASPDGMKLFGVLRVNADYEGVGFAVGLRNANDKSMRVGIVSGYRVFCCDNLAFSGDFNPMLQKHSKNLDLIESVSIAIDRIQRQWQPLRTAIDFKRTHQLNDDAARNMFYRLFTDYKVPVSMFRTVHQEYFVKPSFEEFKPRTLWSFENAITTAFKKLKPIAQYEQTAKVGKFISGYIQSAN